MGIMAVWVVMGMFVVMPMVMAVMGLNSGITEPVVDIAIGLMAMRVG